LTETLTKEGDALRNNTLELKLQALAAEGASDKAIELARGLHEANEAMRERLAIEKFAESIVTQLEAQAKALRENTLELKLEALAAAGASDAVIAHARALGEQIAAKRLEDSIGAIQNSLYEQIETFGESAAAIQRWRLVQQGATDDELAFIDAQEAFLQTLRDEKKIMDDLESAAERVRKSVATPQEKFEKEMKLLRELRDHPDKLIDEDTFKRAAEKAKEILGGTEFDTQTAAGTGVLARTAQGPGSESILVKSNKRQEKLLQDIKDNQAEFAAQPVLIKWS